MGWLQTDAMVSKKDHYSNKQYVNPTNKLKICQ